MNKTCEFCDSDIKGFPYGLISEAACRECFIIHKTEKIGQLNKANNKLLQDIVKNNKDIDDCASRITQASCWEPPKAEAPTQAEG